MNQTIIINTTNWNPKCSISFAIWYKYYIKSEFELKEDYVLLNYKC